MAGYCPRDGTQLETVKDQGIEIDDCSKCRGSWYDYDELAELEATVADEDQRLGTVEFAKHESDLACPTCEQTMHAFNYRAYNLELDACSEGHGFWLDDGEAQRVREIMKERVRGLSRAAGAQTAWSPLRHRHLPLHRYRRQYQTRAGISRCHAYFVGAAS